VPSRTKGKGEPAPPALVPPNIERLVPYAPGKPIEEVERELGVAGAKKLASNENPLGPSPLGMEAARRALVEMHRYPDGNAHALRQALATRLSVTMDEIVVGNGSAELIELLVRTFFGYDVSGLLAAASSHTRICFIANPNNPTGTHLPRSELERLARELPAHVILAVDEAYFEYATADDYPDTLTLRGLRKRLLTMRTFSKAYGLAGLRVGYLVAPPEIASYVQRVRPAFNVNSLAQVAALAALTDEAHLTRTRELSQQGLEYLTSQLSRLGVRVWPSQANFVFVDLGRDALPVYEALLGKVVIVRPVGGPRHLRITAGLPEENERLVRALEEVLA
jgi:histidinol-phosphate aminotransferase